MNDNHQKFSAISGFCNFSKRTVFRLIVNAGAHNQLFTKDSYEIRLLDVLNIKYDDENGDFSLKVLMQSLKIELSKLENLTISLPNRSALIKNLSWLKDKFNLNNTEYQILLFLILIRQDHHLRYVISHLERLSSTQIIYILSQTLNVSEITITKSITANSKLVRSGLLNITDSSITNIFEKLYLPVGFSYQMCLPQKDPYKLFGDSFKQSKCSKLTENNYLHISDEFTYLTAYLKQSMLDNKCGVNILIFGEPGMGKTEFVRMLSDSLKFNAFEVASSRIDGSAIAAKTRMQSYLIAQSTLGIKAKKRLIMFDEADDVLDYGQKFETDLTVSSKALSGGKCWLNSILENNIIPTFWVANNISGIDRANLRRFDFHLEMKTPSKSTRLKIIRQYTKTLPLTDAWRSNLADNDSLVPSDIERTNKVVTAIVTQMPSISAEKAMNTILKNSLSSLSKPFSMPALSQALNYRIDALNTSIDLSELADSLSKCSEAKLCFYGPPGTGKTAFAKQLANLIGVPLIAKRASDIISPYVGETERNIAQLFSQARQEGALLLLDEVDSFLRSREQAQKSWEITAVNEMLTQMENFEGVFVASTNLMKDIDDAALRRFDLKIEFNYLKHAQNMVFLQELSQVLSLKLDEIDIQKVKRLNLLTPGDFLNVVRQAKLIPIKTSQELIARLEKECVMKPNFKSHSIGFAA